MKKLSAKRTQILDFIMKYSYDNGFPPSIREICEAVGLKSPSTVHSHIRILKEAGYLDDNGGKTRSLTLTKKSNVLQVPIIGTVTAGAPILAYEDNLGYVSYDGHVSGELFALNVKGDSMINAGIFDGDVVVVKKTPTAENGQIVVALIEDEATVKRLLRKDGHIFLMPENEVYSPIDGDESTILGVVVSLRRDY